MFKKPEATPAKRGRQPLPAPEPAGPQLDRELLAGRQQELIAAHEAGGIVTTETAVGWATSAMYAGRIQAALVAETVSSRIIAEAYSEIVKSNSYVGLAYQAVDGSAKHVSSLEEFCEVFLGKSARRCQQLASNLTLLGAELYEAAERIGLGQRDYNALKALPADDQVVIRQALEAGADREAVTGQLVTLAAKQAKELEESRATVDAKDKNIARLSEQLNRAEERADKARHAWKRATPDEQLEQLLEAARERAQAVRNVIGLGSEEAGLSGALIALVTHEERHARDTVNVRAQVGGIIADLINTLRTLRDSDGVMAPVIDDKHSAEWSPAAAWMKHED
jgi:predicted  nucleic acid-binding Zn-ribbon protein